MFWFVNSHRSPSKFLEKIGWVSIPPKSIKVLKKVFDASLQNKRTLSKKTLTKFLMENFDRVNGP
jgi:hypothetical protein